MSSSSVGSDSFKPMVSRFGKYPEELDKLLQDNGWGPCEQLPELPCDPEEFDHNEQRRKLQVQLTQRELKTPGSQSSIQKFTASNNLGIAVWLRNKGDQNDKKDLVVTIYQCYTKNMRNDLNPWEKEGKSEWAHKRYDENRYDETSHINLYKTFHKNQGHQGLYAGHLQSRFIAPSSALESA
jgi:hypothetical protein